MPRKVASSKPVELDRSRMPVILAVMAVVGVSATVGAVMWGRSDAGVIDVSATIANSQYASEQNESGGAPVAAPAQEFIDMPNGGLVAQDPGSAPPPPEPAPQATASTTMEEGTSSESTDTGEVAGEATRETEANVPGESANEEGTVSI